MSLGIVSYAVTQDHGHREIGTGPPDSACLASASAAAIQVNPNQPRIKPTAAMQMTRPENLKSLIYQQFSLDIVDRLGILTIYLFKVGCVAASQHLNKNY
ncbi:MAG: hypothetical protein AB2598_05920 [Candidatus Thiodiazotropha sp.]